MKLLDAVSATASGSGRSGFSASARVVLSTRGVVGSGMGRSGGAVGLATGGFGTAGVGACGRAGPGFTACMLETPPVSASSAAPDGLLIGRITDTGSVAGSGGGGGATAREETTGAAAEALPATPVGAPPCTSG